MTIGRLAKEAGVRVETIRFYERRGLLARPGRRPSGYRDYTGDALRRVQFVQRAKGLGFSLRETSDLLRLRVQPGESCASVKKQAESKLADIELRLRELRHMKAALSRLAAECTGKGPSSECPLLDALEAVDRKRKR